jgi:Flp pilus assembly protein protease CpaA
MNNRDDDFLTARIIMFPGIPFYAICILMTVKVVSHELGPSEFVEWLLVSLAAGGMWILVIVLLLRRKKKREDEQEEKRVGVINSDEANFKRSRYG